MATNPTSPDSPNPHGHEQSEEKEKLYVGLSPDELEAIGAETSGGDSKWYQRQEELELKTAIVARDNMDAEVKQFSADSDQNGEVNTEQSAEDGDAHGPGMPSAENQGLGETGYRMNPDNG